MLIVTADWLKAYPIHWRNEDCGFTKDNTREVQYGSSSPPSVQLKTIILTSPDRWELISTHIAFRMVEGRNGKGCFTTNETSHILQGRRLDSPPVTECDLASQI
jgi:hypothetical protein